MLPRADERQSCGDSKAKLAVELYPLQKNQRCCVETAKKTEEEVFARSTRTSTGTSRRCNLFGKVVSKVIYKPSAEYLGS